MSEQKKYGMSPERIALGDAISFIRDQWDWYDMTPKAVSTGLVLGFASLVGLAGGAAMNYTKSIENLDSAIREVTGTYGDRNNDGYIAQAEKDSLFAEILESFGNPNLRMVSGERPYDTETGEAISRNEFTTQIRSFMDNKRTAK